MLRKLRDDEKGFTLIELLVVILIIGILAAIALPSFLGQQKKGQDASAKSNARNAVSQIETCFTTSETYVGCNLANSGLPVGSTAGNVEVTATGVSNYTIVAHSKSTCDFTVTKSTAGVTSRTAAPAANCPSTSW